ncbi:hypothetical protein Plhal304r1_c029g0095501 [Plasmopara halstedii]
MIVIPSHCCILPLVWGLTLLTTAEATTVRDTVSNAVAVVPNQQMKTHTPSRPDGDRELVEERVFPTSTMTELVEHELQPFADTFVSKKVIDQLHMMKYASNEMEHYDFVDDKAPKDQKAAIATLCDSLKDYKLTQPILPKIFATGKTEKNIFHDFAIAVERKWWLSISTSEMYEALGMPSGIDEHENFVKQLGPLIWDKVDFFEEEDFVELMLTKMRERSKDEIMWAHLIYKMQSEGNFFKPYNALFNNLLRTYDTTTGAYTPIDAVNLLTNPGLRSVYGSALIADESVCIKLRGNLLELSQDELMWAKLMYMLRDDDRAITFYPYVFDKLLVPYKLEGRQLLPSQAITYLTSQDFVLEYESLIATANDVDALLLKKLIEISEDTFMWAKVLYMLRNDESLNVIPGILNNLMDRWTNFGAHTEQISLQESYEVLASTNLLSFSLFKRLINDNSDVSVLKVLRMRSTDEFTWAGALYYYTKESELYSYIFSGVLDALLHSWVAKPYNSVAATESNRILISAYELMLNWVPGIMSHQPTFSDLDNILITLRSHSKDDLMWACFMYKLKHNIEFSSVASKVFDMLLSTGKITKKMPAQHPTASRCIAILTDPSLPSTTKVETLKESSFDELMSAKLLHMLRTMYNEQADSLHNKLLQSLLENWTIIWTRKKNLKKYRSDSLEKTSLGKMIAFAKFSSDNPSEFLLKELQKQKINEATFAVQIRELSKSNDDIEGLLCALFQSWIGKPFDGGVKSEEFARLKTAFDLLNDHSHWQEWQKLDDKDFSLVLRNLSEISNDELMWYRFLRKLQYDTSFSVSLAELVKFLPLQETVCLLSHFDVATSKCLAPKAECGFCKFMKAGPCGKGFSTWETCLDDCKKSGDDFIEKCGPQTLALRDCVEANPEYYHVWNDSPEQSDIE